MGSTGSVDKIGEAEGVMKLLNQVNCVSCLLMTEYRLAIIAEVFVNLSTD